MDNLEETDKRSTRYNLAGLKGEEKRQQIWTNQSRVMNWNCEFKKFQHTKVQNQMASQANSIRHLKKSSPVLLKLFQKFQRKEHSQVHSMRLPSLWYKNQTKRSQKRKLQANSLMNMNAKILKRNPSKLTTPTIH